MSDADRFLKLAALALIRQEGLRVAKSSPVHGLEQAWAPGWDDWDQVLVADGPGVQPAVFAFRANPADYENTARTLYESMVARLATNPIFGSQSAIRIRAVSVFCFQSIDPGVARRLSRSAPSRFYSHVKPELWVVDLSAGRLYAPKAFGVVSSRAAGAVQEAVGDAKQGGSDVAATDLLRAQHAAQSQREVFVSTLRGNVPVVTYMVLAACWAIFLLEPIYHFHTLGLQALSWIPGNKTSLAFGAMQPILIEHGQWWRLFTAMFVHFGFLHIFMNSIGLYSVGSLVERIYGSWKYAIIYITSGLFASITSTLYFVLFGPTNAIAGGASGAIFGIAGVLIVLGIRRHSIVPRAVAIQLSTIMGALIVMNLAFDYFVPGIDLRAHIGGLVAGVVLGYFLMPTTANVERMEPAIR